MNVAYADGSQRDGLGGWGAVLLLPRGETLRLRGQMPAQENGEVELTAALQALRHSPPEQPLALYTDSAPAVQAVTRGSNHPGHQALGRTIRDEATARGVRLRMEHVSRDSRRMQEAHALARAALDGQELPPLSTTVHAEIRRRGGHSELRLRFLRGRTESVRVVRPLQPGVPPALQALLALLDHARDGEALQVRVNSALLPVLWREGVASSDPADRLLGVAHAVARERGIVLDFLP